MECGDDCVGAGMVSARVAVWVGVVAVMLFSTAAKAGELAAPVGPVVLTVDGSITNGNGGGKARFDMAMLKALGIHRTQTETSWTDGMITFEGVLARDVMNAVGAQGSAVNAVALDDYSSQVPLADFKAYDVILAFAMDGKPLSRRDKGPLWIIYPWTELPELKIKETVTHAVWQLKLLTVQ